MPDERHSIPHGCYLKPSARGPDGEPGCTGHLKESGHIPADDRRPGGAGTARPLDSLPAFESTKSPQLLTHGSHRSHVAEFLERLPRPLDLPLPPAVNLTSDAGLERGGRCRKPSAVGKPNISVRSHLGSEGTALTRLVMYQLIPRG